MEIFGKNYNFYQKYFVILYYNNMTTFSPEKFRIFDSSEANYLSMGYVSGNFNIPDTKLEEFYSFIANDKQSSQYCFIDRKTPFYRFPWDLDISDDYIDHFKDIDMPKFWIYMKTKILNAVMHYIDDDPLSDRFKYVHSDRPDTDYKLHLYFPNIILNNQTAMTIRGKVIKLIQEDNIYDLSDKLLNNLVDSSIYKENGLRFMYQIKKDQVAAYGVNHKLSSLTITTDKVEQLKLLSLKTTRQSLNFKPKVNESDISLLEVDMEITRVKKHVQKQSAAKADKKTKIGIKSDGSRPKKLTLRNVYRYNFVYELAHNLKPSRMEEYATWMQFVFLCSNYGWYELAHEISKKCPNKYNEESVDKLLEAVPKSDDLLSIWSLVRWSNEDNPVKHVEIMEKYMTKIMRLKHKHEYIFNEFAGYLQISEDYLKSFDTDKFDTFIVKSGLGTNKTGAVVDAIVKLAQKHRFKKINVIASRVALVTNLLGRFEKYFKEIYRERWEERFNEFNIKSYSEFTNKQKLPFQDKLVQTPDSLIHMRNTGEKLEIPDILFIDEIESLLEYIATSDTLCDIRKKVFLVLKQYISKVKYLFLVDGNLTPTTCEFINRLRPTGKTRILHNTKPTDCNVYHYIKQEYKWMEQLEYDLNNGKNIFIGTDSYDYSEKLFKLLSKIYHNKKIMLYNSKTDQEEKMKLKNVNTIWIKYGVIICSPTITYGVDFSTDKPYFDCVYGHYRTTILPSGIFQQVNRIRNIRQHEVYIFLDIPKGNGTQLPTDIKQLRSYILDNPGNFPKIVDTLSLIDDDGIPKLDIDDDFTMLYIQTIIKRHRADNDFEGELTRCLTEFGGIVIKEIDKTPWSRLADQLDIIKTECQAELNPLNSIYQMNCDLEDDVYKIKLEGCDNVQIKKIQYEHRVFKSKLKREYNKKIKEIKTKFAVKRKSVTDAYKEENKPKTKHDSKMEKVKQDVDAERIGMLLKADGETYKYDWIKTQRNKTKKDLYTIEAYYIKDMFALNSLTEQLITDIGKVTNVAKFYKSLIYFGPDDYYEQYLKSQKTKEMTNLVMIGAKQRHIIKELVNLFWNDGLLSNKQIKVYVGEDALNDEHKQFINKYLNDMYLLFRSIKQRIKPNTPYQVIRLLDTVLKEFFGGFVNLNISKRHYEVRDKIRHHYYIVNINIHKYIELILMRNPKLLDTHSKVIKELYGNSKCRYVESHKCKSINELIDKPKIKYMFVDVPIDDTPELSNDEINESIELE